MKLKRPYQYTEEVIPPHDAGDPFINKLNRISEGAPDAMTAGLLVLAEGMKQIAV